MLQPFALDDPPRFAALGDEADETPSLPSPPALDHERSDVSSAVVHPPRLLTRVRDRIRFKHYSIRTEVIYVDWIKRFIRFHGNRHPSALGAAEVEGYLTHLAV